MIKNINYSLVLFSALVLTGVSACGPDSSEPSPEVMEPTMDGSSVPESNDATTTIPPADSNMPETAPMAPEDTTGTGTTNP